jgi:hypothetical protein
MSTNGHGYKKNKREESFEYYLKKGNLSSPYHLNMGGSLDFHWANWDYTANYIKSHMDKKRSENLENAIGFLKDRLIWLKNPMEQKSSSLYDLYESYCDPRLKKLLFATKDEILVSMDNETGPYHSLKSMRWFDRDLCARFIYKRILENRAPLRQFRLSLSLPVEARLDGNPFTNIKGSITQISESGILVYFPYSAALKMWDKKEADVVFVKKPFAIDQEAELNMPEGFKLQAWYHALANFWLPLERIQQHLNNGQLNPDEQSCYLFLPYQDLHFFGLKERNFNKELEGLLKSVKNGLKEAC